MDSIEKLDSYPGVPDHLFHGIKLYVTKRIQTGSFLQAVLENNLVYSMFYADAISANSIQSIAKLIYNHVPSKCWGSKEKVEAWLRGA